MKYIVFRVKITGTQECLIPVVFPDMLVHSLVAEALSPLWVLHGYLSGTPRSAGEWNSLSGCFGKSSTLKLTSHPDDSDLINGADYGACMALAESLPPPQPPSKGGNPWL